MENHELVLRMSLEEVRDLFENVNSYIRPIVWRLEELVVHERDTVIASADTDVQFCDHYSQPSTIIDDCRSFWSINCYNLPVNRSITCTYLAATVQVKRSWTIVEWNVIVSAYCWLKCVVYTLVLGSVSMNGIFNHNRSYNWDNSIATTITLCGLCRFQGVSPLLPFLRTD